MRHEPQIRPRAEEKNPPVAEANSPVSEVTPGQVGARRLIGDDLVRECRRILGDLGFDLGDRLQEALEKAVEFAEEALHEDFIGEEYQRLAVKRELLRVLFVCWETNIREEHGRGTSEEEHQLVELVEREVTPPEDLPSDRAGAYLLDVGAWRLLPEASRPTKRFRHLHLLSEFVRRQDKRIIARGDPRTALRDAFRRAVER